MDASTKKAEKLQELRALIARHEPAARVSATTIESDLPGLDAEIGGWPSPGLTEIVGRMGSGRLSLILPTLRRLTRADRAVGIVDPLGLIHPPGLSGVRLDRLLIVQPACKQAGWTSEQLAGSGSFELVLHFAALRLGRSGARLARAAERGGCSVVVLAEKPEQGLPAALRLRVEGRDASAVHLRVARCRGGRVGQPLRVSVSEAS
ncbi:MAG: DNA lesion error-prone repair protein ImuA [Proteobacteria bacterium]|nr:DNA lesion error-prone repair protein ImuA [Pseudomonadota bacterium]MCP4918350.1 DNA lesion error-prone repair protein ImuA [Pseudomonadota bacterium]